jgi:hypothetical protein
MSPRLNQQIIAVLRRIVGDAFVAVCRAGFAEQAVGFTGAQTVRHAGDFRLVIADNVETAVAHQYAAGFPAFDWRIARNQTADLAFEK